MEVEIEEAPMEEKKTVGENQEKSGRARKSRTARFLARLQRAWRRLTSCVSRNQEGEEGETATKKARRGRRNRGDEEEETQKTRKKRNRRRGRRDTGDKEGAEEERKNRRRTGGTDGEQEGETENRKESRMAPDDEVPAQSKMAEEDKKGNFPSNQKETSAERKDHAETEDRVTCLSHTYVEQQLLHYNEIQQQMEDYEAVYIQHYSDMENKSSRVNPEQPPPKVLKASAKKKRRTVPLTLRSFTFHEDFGKGGFGKVMVATDKIRKEQVAVKVVYKNRTVGEHFGWEERDILAFSHQCHYLVHGLAAFHTTHYIYYVMELATQGDLDRFMKKSPLDITTARFVTAQTICALQFLHCRAILHRDVKPDNIFLTREGHIKLGDFGLSLMHVHGNIEGRCPGTIGFMAPEIYNKMPYGRGVDFFALGVTLFIMLTGSHPFGCYDRAEVETATLTKTPDYPPSLTPESTNILEGLLAKEQDSRLGVVGEFTRHPFFAGLSWDEVENRTAAPPQTLVSTHGEKIYCRTLKHEEEKVPIKSPDSFEDFSFVSPAWSTDYHPAKSIAKWPFRL